MKQSLISLCFACMLFGFPAVGAEEQAVVQTQSEVQAQGAGKQFLTSAEQPDYTQVKLDVKPCELADIASGVWKMVYFRETPPYQHDRYSRILKYQYMAFFPDSFYARLRSSREIETPEKVTQLVKPDKRPGFEQKFLLNSTKDKSEVILMAGKTAEYRHSCSIVVKPASVYKAGDMILTGYTSGGKTVLYELYRRWF